MKIWIERDDLPMQLVYDEALGDAQPYIVLSHDGLGTPPVERIRTRGYRQDGETDYGGVLCPRRFFFVVVIRAWGDLTLDQARAQLFAWLRPDAECTLTFDKDGHEMSLRAAVVDAIAAPSADRWGDYQRVGIQMEAADPLFRLKQFSQIAFVGGSGTQGWMVPTAVPIVIGDGGVNSSQVFSIESTYYSSVVIDITGPCTAATVAVNGRALSITSIQSGRRVVIDTAYGVMSAMEYEGDAVVGSRFADLSGALDLRMRPGPNMVEMSMVGSTSETYVMIRWRETFLSL